MPSTQLHRKPERDPSLSVCPLLHRVKTPELVGTVDRSASRPRGDRGRS